MTMNFDGVGRYIYGAIKFGGNLDDVKAWMAEDLGKAHLHVEDDEVTRELYEAFFAKYRDMDALVENHGRFMQVLKNRPPSLNKSQPVIAPRRISTPRFIASDDILWLRADGTEALIQARVGEPYQIDAQTWACPAELLGVDGRYPDIVGGSSLQALSLAIKLVATRLGHMLSDNAQLVHREDRSPWDGSSLGGLQEKCNCLWRPRR